MTFCFDTIRSSDDIARALKIGDCYRGASVLLFVAPIEKNRCGSVSADGAEKSRVAYLAGKRLGGAVWRNRSKRVLRAAWRELLESSNEAKILFDSINDFLLVANKRTSEAGSHVVADELRTFCQHRIVTKC